MLTALVNFFNFYQKYLWSPTDFLNFQNAFLYYIGWLAAPSGTGRILAGLLPSAGGGMVVSVSPGVCAGGNGQLMYLPTTGSATLATPAGNPAISLVVMRPTIVQNNNINQPTNPAVQVPLWQQYTYTLVAINGTPASTPVAPATLAGDVIVAEVHLTSGQSTITEASFFYNLTNANSGLRVNNIRVSKAVSDTALVTDQIVEFDATSGSITSTLVDPGLIPGVYVRYQKIDSSANTVTLSASQLISGQSTVVLVSQWDNVLLYSNGNSYRIAS